MKPNIMSAIILLAFLSTPLLYSQEEEDGEDYPIDLELAACLDIDSNMSTLGMISCIQEAEDAWDRELNLAYRELVGALDSSGQEGLRKAQRAWLAWRDAEFELNGIVYYENLDGTMYHIFAADREMQIVRARALELRDYLDALRDFGE